MIEKLDGAAPAGLDLLQPVIKSCGMGAQSFERPVGKYFWLIREAIFGLPIRIQNRD